MHTGKDLISIGIPVYNGGFFLKQTLGSLLSQTYNNFELIISDDCSYDNTDKICQEYHKRDKRIKYFRQKKNIGFQKNYNFVLYKATGKYFFWAGQDDFWDKDFLRKLHSLLVKNPDAVLVMCNFDNIYNGHHIHNQPSGIVGQTSKFSSLLNFIKKGDLSYFYGLHVAENLKKVGGYLPSSRPFFRSSDYATIFKVLTYGRMVFTKEILFYKRDTGYHFARYEIVRNLSFNRRFMKTILRYACFPLFYLYNLFYSIKCIFPSDFILKQKIIIFFYILISYFKNNVVFLHNVSTGIFYLFMGIGIKLRKLFKISTGCPSGNS